MERLRGGRGGLRCDDAAGGQSARPRDGAGAACALGRRLDGADRGAVCAIAGGPMSHRVQSGHPGCGSGKVHMRIERLQDTSSIIW